MSNWTADTSEQTKIRVIDAIQRLVPKLVDEARGHIKRMRTVQVEELGLPVNDISREDYLWEITDKCGGRLLAVFHVEYHMDCDDEDILGKMFAQMVMAGIIK